MSLCFPFVVISMNLNFLAVTVVSVRSARQVIDALNSEGPAIDIILAEVDLPVKKGMKLLKYITRDKELRRIPVISKSLASLLFSPLSLVPLNFHSPK